MEMITANRNSLQAKDDQRRRDAKVSQCTQAFGAHVDLLSDKIVHYCPVREKLYCSVFVFSKK